MGKRSQEMLGEAGYLCFGAGGGVFGVIGVEAVVGDGPTTRSGERQTEGALPSNQEFFPYDTGVEVGGAMLAGVLVAVAIRRRIRGRVTSY